MGDKGHSERNLFGGYTHYDSKGKKIGTSEPGIFGGYTNYDANGKKTGHSDPGFFGSYNHYDNSGKKTGHTDPSLFGEYRHYDSKGKSTGSSTPNLTGGYSNSSDGCYVATCVYGSYDHPQVWTLRRFRDSYLGSRFWGRCFIHSYYAISPTLVALFGETKWFRRFWKLFLDRFVYALNQKGYENSPYNDIDWRNHSAKEKRE